MRENLLLSRLADTGVVAIVRGINREQILPLVQALYDGGVRIVEITLNTPDALSLIERTVDQFGESMHVGAGTVLSAEAAKKARKSGAVFFVTPHVALDVIRFGSESNLPVMAGAMTPTEILTAYRAGSTLVKVFPIEALGARYLRELRGPFPDIPFVAVGGVTLQNAAEILVSGASAFGIGGSLVDKSALERRDYAVITQKARDFVELYRSTMDG